MSDAARWEPMRPLGEPFASPTADAAHLGPALLEITSPDDARTALAAARALPLYTPPTVAWQTGQRVAFAVVSGIYALLVSRNLVGSWPVLAIVCVVLLPVVASPWESRSGSEPRGRTWRLLGFLIGLAIVLFAFDDVLGGQEVVPLLLWLLIAPPMIAAPTVRLILQRRREPGPPPPPGSEAFIILSALAPAQWVDHRHLAATTRMPEPVLTQWLDQLRCAGWAIGGSPRRNGRHRRVEITGRGREQLDEWRAELEKVTQSDSPR